MSLSQNPADFSPAAIRQLNPAKYTSLGDFINQVNKPDNRDMLVKTYGTQTITGFLQMTGAVKANGADDSVQYWEETRLHPAQVFNVPIATAGSNAITVTLPSAAVGTGSTAAQKSAAAKYLRKNDVVLLNGVERFIVTDIDASITSTSVTATAIIKPLASGGLVGAFVASAQVQVPIVGNLFAQGSDQNSGFLESDVVKRTNPYMILKETYKVTGSQATNIGWINLGNGDYRWYIKSEMDTRKRFLDKREMMMLLGVQNTNNVSIVDSNGRSASIEGSEGYFAALENRGMIHGGYIETLADVDAMVTEFDKQGASPEYAMYVNRKQDLYLDDLIARGLATSMTANPTIGSQAFGAFGNDPAAAVKLGFTSFKRGSYTFHKQAWKLLNEPTLLGIPAAGGEPVYKGVAIPLSTVVDPKTGDRSPALEMNYKAANGYSREMEHWMTGSILGVSNTNVDSLQFNYRSECNLVTRGANRHVLIK
jgi:hypothetical protein